MPVNEPDDLTVAPVSCMGATVGARLKRGRRDAILPQCQRQEKRRRRDGLRFRASARERFAQLLNGVIVDQRSSYAKPKRENRQEI